MANTSTSGGFSSYRVSPSEHRSGPDPINTSDVQAELSRQQVRLFDSHFQPHEEEMLGLVGDEGYAGQMARRAHDLSTARAETGPGVNQAQRQARRYGARMSPRDQHRGERQRGLTAAVAGAGAANEGRQQAREHQLELGEEMNQIGQQLSQRASETVGEAANMYRERGRQYQQQKAQAKGEPSGMLGLDLGPL